MGRDAEERGEKRRERRETMTQPQQHCDHECVCPDYKASHSENGEDECYGDPDPCSLSCYHRSHPYQSERDKVLDDSLERLSAIEHEQWIEWSKNIASTEPNISFERVERWSNLWIPYEQLSDEMKEHDRKWARKIIKELRQAGEQE